jgi:hypothetical protein
MAEATQVKAIRRESVQPNRNTQTSNPVAVKTKPTTPFVSILGSRPASSRNSARGDYQMHDQMDNTASNPDSSSGATGLPTTAPMAADGYGKDYHLPRLLNDWMKRYAFVI